MSNENTTIEPNIEKTAWWKSFVTTENVVTSITSLVIFLAIILPLFWLIVSSFQILDDMGFDTEWGLGNYYEVFQVRVIRKAFINTLIIIT